MNKEEKYLKRAINFRKRLVRKAHSLAKKIALLCKEEVIDLGLTKTEEVELPTTEPLYFLLVIKDSKAYFQYGIEDDPLAPAFDAYLPDCYIEDVAAIVDRLKKILKEKRTEALREIFAEEKFSLHPGMLIVKSFLA